MKLREKIRQVVLAKTGWSDSRADDATDAIISILTDPDDETVERVVKSMDSAAREWAAQWHSSLLPSDKLPTPADCPYSVTARAALSSLGEG